MSPHATAPLYARSGTRDRVDRRGANHCGQPLLPSCEPGGTLQLHRYDRQCTTLSRGNSRGLHGFVLSAGILFRVDSSRWGRAVVSRLLKGLNEPAVFCRAKILTAERFVSFRVIPGIVFLTTQLMIHEATRTNTKQIFFVSFRVNSWIVF